MNHRGERARPPSFCRSGREASAAPAFLVAQGPRLLGMSSWSGYLTPPDTGDPVSESGKGDS